MPIKKQASVTLKTKGEALVSKQEKYKGITRLLMFLIVKIQSNITFSILMTSCFSKNPLYQYIKVVKTILRYLREYRKCGIIYEEEENLIREGYLNFDWMANKNNKKSTSSFIIKLNNNSVNYCSKR